jgi:hypothetical protein
MRIAGALGVCGAAAMLTLSTAGAQKRPRFYDDDPLRREPIRNVTEMVRYEPDLFYDTVENVFTKPGDRDFDKRAGNVNTVDEVMDGPWFTNRAGTRPLAVEEVARGPNAGNGPAPGTWTVISAKSDGVTPGFTVRDANGEVWFVKFDPPRYRGMSTGTEVAASKLIWALGYHTVEYHITQLREGSLVVADTANVTPPGATQRRMRQEDLTWLKGNARPEADGTFRAIVSKAAPGRPVGRIRYHGTRSDDPNDLVPHENRRELRGWRVFAAWLNHVDAKSIQSLDALVKDGERSYVRHYMIDFSSAMGAGSIHPRDYFEGYEPVVEPFGEIGKRALSLGFRIPRWRTVDYDGTSAIGRVPVDHSDWDPDQWTPRFPNAAFLRAREDDKFWAAVKLAAVTKEMIAAALREGRFEDERGVAILQKFLEDRRRIILQKYLPAINPVVDLAMDATGGLSFANAAVDAGVAKAPDQYTVAWAAFDNGTGEVTPIAETTGGARQQAPAGALGASFVRVAISASGGGAPESWSKPIHAYFRKSGGSWTLVGLERLPHRPGP